jgi:hypothetical protein
MNERDENGQLIHTWSKRLLAAFMPCARQSTAEAMRGCARGEIGVSREKAVVSLLAGSLGTVCGCERGVNVKRVQARGTGAGQRVKSE